MWVKIIPIGGIKSTWENWVTLPGGAKIAIDRRMGPLNIKMTNVMSGKSYKDCGLEKDPFLSLSK
jgi:hypothetical protein